MYLVVLVLAKRRRVLLEPHRLDRLWRIWPLNFAFFGVACYDLRSTIIAPLTQHSTNLASSLAIALPVSAFGLLLFSEAASWLFSMLAPTRTYASLRHPVLCVHTMTLLYYLVEPSTAECIMCAASRGCLAPVSNQRQHPNGVRARCFRLRREDAFGRPLYPLRYVMWTVSVSCM